MTSTVEDNRQVASEVRAAGINEALTVMPDEKGHFGPYGGQFVSEILMTALAELDQALSSPQE